MDVVFLFLKYYSFFLIIVIVFLGIGFLTYQLLPLNKNSNNPYGELFYSFFSGLIVFATVFSLVATKGRTINIIFIFSGSILLFKYFTKSGSIRSGLLQRAFQFLKRNWIVVVLSTFIFYTYEAVWLLKSGNFNFILPFVDYVDMYNISQIITQTGQENNKFLISNYYFDAFHGISPYHYFELWLNGFLSVLLPVSGMVTLMLFVYPLFYVASYLGILAIWEHYGKVTFFKAALSFIILFTGGMYFEFYNRYELLKWYGGTVGNIAHIWGKKSAVLYPFVMASYLHFINNKNATATVLLLCTGIVSIGVMPGISGGILLFILLNRWHKTYTRADIKFLYLLYLIFIIIFVGIYLLWGNKNEESLGFSKIISDFFSAFDLSFIKTLFFRMVFSELRLLVIFSPFLLLIWHVIFRKKTISQNNSGTLQRILLLLLLILATGSLTGTLASINLFSGGQFFSYLFPILIIYIILTFVAWFSHLKQHEPSGPGYINALIILLFTASALYNISNNIQLQRHYKEVSINLYSESYLSQVTTYLDTHNKNPLGVCFMGNEDLMNYPLNAYGITGLTFSGMSVKLTRQFHAVSNLSIFDLELDTSSSFNNSLFKSFEFYNYVKQQKAQNTFISAEQSKADFVNSQSIDYALVYRHGVLPDALKEKVVTSYTDSISGQCFVVFN